MPRRSIEVTWEQLANHLAIAEKGLGAMLV